jgi:Ser/Thr protein kinase RdoA (MazF antagonist)
MAHTAMETTGHPYDALTPEIILEAVEQFGVRCTGGMLALSSYENRVYRVDTEGDGPRVAKFYRPERWSDAAILEEHEFARAAAEHEIPVVAPLLHAGGTLHQHGGFRFAVFPWQPGRAPEITSMDDFHVLGRYLGRLHLLGSHEPFRHRLRLTVAEFGDASVARLRESPFLPPDVVAPFCALADQLLPLLRQAFDTAGDVATIRLHGDFHLGNILWSDYGPFLVDFDDCVTGPAVQDLWMVLSGDHDDIEAQLSYLLAGYRAFAAFNPVELQLIEPLRTLRLLRYNAWIAARWDDPAFPRSFPWFSSPHYWQEQRAALRTQQLLLMEPPVYRIDG